MMPDVKSASLVRSLVNVSHRRAIATLCHACPDLLSTVLVTPVYYPCVIHPHTGPIHRPPNASGLPGVAAAIAFGWDLARRS
jgi:hypothetical protein